jgi:fatty-acyl-CoA synthase
MLTHGNITWNVINLPLGGRFRSDDVTIAITPFFRTGGTGVNVLPVLFSGGMVIIPEADPDEILRLITEQRHDRIGTGSARGAHAIGGLANGRFLERPLLHHRWCTRPERLIRTYMQRGVTFLQGMGSEGAPFVLLLDPANALRKVGSAGKPALFVDIRTDRADGTACAPNETDELVVTGPNVMAGY